jgi:hypothetical protein
MKHPTTLMMLAGVVAIAASCNGSSGSTDGGGSLGGSGGHASGAGGAAGGTGGPGTGGQGGIDNLCVSEGETCGASGPRCCGGSMCCFGSSGQASCVAGSCTGAEGGQGGAGGVAGKAAGGTSGNGSGGSGGKGTGGAPGGAGGNQTFSCGSDTCTVGETFCYSYTPGTAGQTGRSCEATPVACASAPTSCACLCPPSSSTAVGCVPVGMGAGNFCTCSDTGGVVNLSCAGS